jgi:2-oxoglutarate ferredoxin oxidoreductase subunit beta
LVSLSDYAPEDLWIHDEADFFKAQLLTRMFDDVHTVGHFPRPFGVFYQGSRATYEDQMNLQLEEIIAVKGKGDLDKLLEGSETWTID